MLKWTVTKRSDDPLGQRRPYHARRSLGVLQGTQTTGTPTTSRPVRARRSLASVAAHQELNKDKENRYTSTPCIQVPQREDLSQLALRDVSNISTPTSVAPAKKRAFPNTPVLTSTMRKKNAPYSSTLPTFDVEYSPCDKLLPPFAGLPGLGESYYENARYFHENLPPAKKKQKLDVTEKPEQTFKVPKIEQQQQPKVNNNDDESLHSSQMGDITLDRMIDAILESARKERPKRSASVKSKESVMSPTYTAADDPASDLNLTMDLSPEKYLEADKTIIIEECHNEREVRTPDSPKVKRKHSPESCHLRRQRAVRRKVKEPKQPQLQQLQQKLSPVTPKYAMEETYIRKTLDELAQIETPKTHVLDMMMLDTFYPASQNEEKFLLSDCSKISNETTPEMNWQASSTPTGEANIIRKCLTFSPPGTSDESIEKRRSVASSISRYTRTPITNGTIDVAMHVNEDKLYIHVIRCRDLQRPGHINAYVKVALLPMDSNCYQRTAVHRNSSRPFFDHRFEFDLDQSVESKRIQLAVWHRDREYKRSEFLGCMSFPVKTIIKKEINGSFRLQPQSCLTNPNPPVPVTTTTTTATPATTILAASTMCEYSQSGSEEIVSLDDGGLGGSTVGVGSVGSTTGTTEQILLSKKALHQRDADENLFLRFLELDPVQEQSGRRQSASLSYKNSNGRTPFTITKRLARVGDRGFGLSLVWTHPPRVEKIESGLSAEKAGILPGDYVVFVDKHNVVTMPEADVLNLIKAQGNTLALEIFRRPAATKTNGIKTRLLNLNPNSATPVLSQTVVPPPSYQQQQQQQQLPPSQFQLPPAQSVVVNSQPQSTPVHASTTTLQSTPSIQHHHQQTLLRQQPVTSTSTLAEIEDKVATCSNTSIEKRRLHLPQVTFSKESILPTTPEDHRRRFLYQLINREQHFVTALNFGNERFMNPLKERRDLISPNDHKVLFQNIDELSRISEDILEQLMHDDTEPQIHYASRVYLSKTTAICAAYKKYCTGLKKADCVLVNKSRNLNCDFMKFITEPPVPRKRPDLTTYIHRPLQHFRELLKLVQMIASYCRLDTEEYNNFQAVINEIQSAYREITTTAGLMEPLCDGRPLLTLQDLEARLVFTKCKPFVLATSGRQWIFGGDLSKVEGKSVKPYWTLLFSDMIMFAKVSRDRVLFITEDPIPLNHIVDSSFNIKRKGTEFRLTTDPNGRPAESPTVHCGPDITRTPRKGSKRKQVLLRAPSAELKAVWQNLITRQIFLVNAALGSTPLSSPLESPDLIQTLLPYGEIGATTASVSSVKLSMDNIHLRNQPQPKPSPSPTASSSISKQIEDLIDEKCRNLNKTGTSRGGALHLAQWMKCQLEKQIIESDPINSDTDEPNITDWSPEEVHKRSEELNLIDLNGVCCKTPVLEKRSQPNTVPVRPLDVQQSKSASRSTTPDSQITVRSPSPLSNKVDTISVCRDCSQKCKSRLSSSSSNSLLLVMQKSQSCPGSEKRASLISNDSTISSATSTVTGQTNSSGKQQLIDQSPSNKSSKSSLDINSNKNPEYRIKSSTPCSCKCTPKDFEGATVEPDEVKQETVKILNDVNEGKKQTPQHVILGTPNRVTGGAKSVSDEDCMCDKIEDFQAHEEEDWSLMLIGLAQINPAATLVNLDPFEAVPTISVVPPTPEGLNRHFSNPSIWEANKLSPEEAEDCCIVPKVPAAQSSFSDDSPLDEEPPYLALNTTLKRYGTMSSLERVPSEDTDEKTYNSSEEDSESEVKILPRDYPTHPQSFKAWTTRAGNFLEESRAFIDKYLVKRDGVDAAIIIKADEPVESSGATSGDDIWGTPTSGGEYDDAHTFVNTDHSQMSPTKSSSSYTGDEDAEFIMDELLMAPPMAASNVRGLLPSFYNRRRLEPLFEEDSESGESGDEAPLNTAKVQQGQSMVKQCAAGVNLDEQTGSDSSPTTSHSSTSPPPPEPRGQNAITTTPVKITTTTFGNGADKYYASVPIQETKITKSAESTDQCAIPSNVVQQQPVPQPSQSTEVQQQQPPRGLSPRLEMRLAMNRDILYDEDLMNYEPGPDLTTILGHDLSTYRRISGRDIIMNRIVSSSSRTSSPMHQNGGMNTSAVHHQNNSKMDTPIPNRKKLRLPTWNTFGSADRGESALTDLERLARREKIYCTTQISRRPMKGIPLNDDDMLNTTASAKRPNKLFKFFSRRNSEQLLTASTSNNSRFLYDERDSVSATSRSVSPNKDLDKPLLDRRFWKQLSRRRRSNSFDASI